MTDCLDPSIGSHCDLACELTSLDRAALAILAPFVSRIDPTWWASWMLSAMSWGMSIGVAMAASVPRVHTGYLPEGQRRSVFHLSYCEGFIPPPKATRADDRAKAAAGRWFDDVHGAVGLPVGGGR